MNYELIWIDKYLSIKFNFRVLKISYDNYKKSQSIQRLLFILYNIKFILFILLMASDQEESSSFNHRSGTSNVFL